MGKSKKEAEIAAAEDALKHRDVIEMAGESEGENAGGESAEIAENDLVTKGESG